MKKKTAGAAVLAVTAAAAVVLCGMRVVTMNTALDENGLLLPGNRLPLIMAVFLVLALAAAALLLSVLEKRPAFSQNFSGRAGWLVPVAAAAALFVLSGVLKLGAAQSGFETLVALLAVLGGGLLLVQTVVQLRGGRQTFVLLLLPCIWLILRLVFDYKEWGEDPVLLDYCFLLLADITCMLSAYHVAGFSFDRGKRRLTAFWCAAAVMFSAVGLADSLRSGGAAEALHSAGMLLWMGTALCQLCTDRPAPESE